MRHPLAPVPHDDRAGAVVARGDEALEVAVLERVILDVHREPLVGRVVRGSFRHGPGAEHALHLEPEIEVQPAGGVLVHDEEAAAPVAVLRDGAGGLRRALERALGAVGVEVVGLGGHALNRHPERGEGSSSGRQDPSLRSG